MLLTLHIENIAAIEKVDIDFRKGMNVLTGETGAGKSIVIDSLEAALGWRTSRELVRTGAENAVVTASFSADGTKAWCEENDIDASDGELVLMRKISTDGRTSCRVNGVPVSAAQTKALALQLIDIHGQGDGQKLLDEKYHLSYLDGYAGLKDDADDYYSDYCEYIRIKKELDALECDAGDRERKLDMLRYQVDEIENAEITAGELDEKMKRRDLLKNSGKLSEAVNDAYYSMYGGERSGGIIDSISALESTLSKEARYSEDIENIVSKLSELRYSAEDVAADIRAIQDALEFSPGELEEVEERVDRIRRIIRKYGGTEEAALEFLDKGREELDLIENFDERIAKLKSEVEIKRNKALKKAQALSDKRRKASLELSAKIEAQLHELSMPGAVFIASVDSIDGLNSTGCDNVRFTMSANVGEAPGAINRVASGGELSRIMLAMKAVLSSNDTVPVMVFDEIDTGVSGIAAQKVAEKLALISGDKQVICVTHLPQIAVMADTQYSVVKQQSDGRTYTNVLELDRSGRKNEIARLIGGETVTDITLAGAEEQLNSAESYKRGIRK